MPTQKTPTATVEIEKNIVLVDIAKLKPYDRNAKKHTEEQIAAVANSIRRFGFNVPIIIDLKMVIVAGHCRYEAAKQLGMAKIPCIVKTKLTPKGNPGVPARRQQTQREHLGQGDSSQRNGGHQRSGADRAHGV
jgi:hypothetical protein